MTPLRDEVCTSAYTSPIHVSLPILHPRAAAKPGGEESRGLQTDALLSQLLGGLELAMLIDRASCNCQTGRTFTTPWRGCAYPPAGDLGGYKKSFMGEITSRSPELIQDMANISQDWPRRGQYRLKGRRLYQACGSYEPTRCLDATCTGAPPER